MAVEYTTRERLRAIDERLEKHSGRLDELQMMAAQSEVTARAIQAAMSRATESVSSSARWIRLACTVVALSALTAAGATVYLVLR